MLRTRLAKSYIKRTFRPIYGWTQMTPKSVFLDPAWDRSVPLYPGMVLAKGAGDLVTPLGLSGVTSANTTKPYGFGALYVGGDGIDEVLDSGINAFAVWVMGPDAEAELLAPAFDNNLTYVDGDLLYGCTAAVTTTQPGQVVPTTFKTANGSSTTTQPVARVLKVNSATKITIGGLFGTV
jgi:hypothetical protein